MNILAPALVVCTLQCSNPRKISVGFGTGQQRFKTSRGQGWASGVDVFGGPLPHDGPSTPSVSVRPCFDAAHHPHFLRPEIGVERSTLYLDYLICCSFSSSLASYPDVMCRVMIFPVWEYKHVTGLSTALYTIRTSSGTCIMEIRGE